MANVHDWIDATLAERPAFPAVEPAEIFDEETGDWKAKALPAGLTVHQWYQGKAIEGLCADLGARTAQAFDQIARDAQGIADAMCALDEERARK